VRSVPGTRLPAQSVEVALSIEDRTRQATSLTNLAPLDIGTRRPDAALPLLGESTGSTTVRRTTASLSRPARQRPRDASRSSEPRD
jgi:hypothetical protein